MQTAISCRRFLGPYGMAETVTDLIALLDQLNSGPATVVATSFVPAAALWAAAERPTLIGRLVLVSAHLEAAPIWQRLPLALALRGR
jgi:pimeloyl-ACP methyl ester carboxylesterase